mmetsp:Transcript_34970/g.112306  ORF Transcript_34970/g.112306 Transcript_34970/m.112306 type:complete len:290 (-) Transcript_34970:106-975(-)
MLVKAAARRASCLVPRLAPVLSIKSLCAFSTSSADPSENHWCDNLLTVTGPRADIAAFADANVATSPSFLPQRTPFGGLAFLASAPGPLSFQPLLPISESGILEHDRCEEAWGCTTDARDVQMHPGQPRIKGRKSVRYEFCTGEGPPERWLQSAAAHHPRLRFDLHYLLLDVPSAFEVGYLRGQRLFRSQVSVDSWMWRHRVERDAFFAELKGLLGLPDGRLPRKRKLKPAEVEARLAARGAADDAILLLCQHLQRGARSYGRATKLWYQTVLPEFAAWLYTPAGLRLA